MWTPPTRPSTSTSPRTCRTSSTLVASRPARHLEQCVDVGQQQWLAHVTDVALNARKAVTQQNMTQLAELAGVRDAFDENGDKHKFFNANHELFALPRKFEFRCGEFFVTS